MDTIKKLLLIGLDAADWKVINPLMKKGYMPNLQKLINNGSSGPLETLDPPFSPMLWTSIATGKTAEKHGIHGFIEPDISSGSVRPVSSVSRKVKALWNIFTNQNKISNIIGWWPSTPAEPINGIMVSNNFQKDVANKAEWSLDKAEIHPEEMYEDFLNLRVHPSEINPQLILDFVPKAREIDQEKDSRLSTLVKFLSHSFSIKDAALKAMDKNNWDFTAVYFDALDHFSHAFMRYHAPKLPTVSQEDFDIYNGIINKAYILHDLFLGELINKAGNACDFLIVSDHGFHSDHNRPLSLPKINGGPALEHNPIGVMIASGPNFKKQSELVVGKNLLDIAPTILHYFDLPIGEDMDGAVIQELFNNSKVEKSIVSWENVPGHFGEHHEYVREIGLDDEDSIRQLEELGYIEREGGNAQERVQNAILDGKYNLSMVYNWKGDSNKAIEILEGLLAESPNDIRFLMDLCNHYLDKGLFNAAKEILLHFKTVSNKKYVRLGLLEAKLHRLMDNLDDAFPLLFAELEARPQQIQAHLELARCYMAQKEFSKTEKQYRQVLSIHENSGVAYLGLARALFRQEKYMEALEPAFKAIELKPNWANPHFILAEILTALKEYESAKTALETVLKLNERHYVALEKYIEVLEKTKASENLIQELKEKRSNNNEEVIFIVTGLPRSGTSLGMQLLEASSIEVFSDKIRVADENNPKGYYEYEPVKQLHKKNQWLDDSKNKALKVVLPHIFKLPKRYKYKVVHMYRKVDDVLISQELMKKRLNPGYKTQYNFGLYQKFENELERLKKWYQSQPNVECLVLDYDQVVNKPELAAEKILQFTKVSTSIEQVASVVETSLQRSNQTSINI